MATSRSRGSPAPCDPFAARAVTISRRPGPSTAAEIGQTRQRSLPERDDRNDRTAAVSHNRPFPCEQQRLAPRRSGDPLPSHRDTSGRSARRPPKRGSRALRSSTSGWGRRGRPLRCTSRAFRVQSPAEAESRAVAEAGKPRCRPIRCSGSRWGCGSDTSRRRESWSRSEAGAAPHANPAFSGGCGSLARRLTMSPGARCGSLRVRARHGQVCLVERCRRSGRALPQSDEAALWLDRVPQARNGACVQKAPTGGLFSGSLVVASGRLDSVTGGVYGGGGTGCLLTDTEDGDDGAMLDGDEHWERPNDRTTKAQTCVREPGPSSVPIPPAIRGRRATPSRRHAPSHRSRVSHNRGRGQPSARTPPGSEAGVRRAAVEQPAGHRDRQLPRAGAHPELRPARPDRDAERLDGVRERRSRGPRRRERRVDRVCP